METECYCEVCGRQQKVKRLLFLPTVDKLQNFVIRLQIQIDLKCGHTLICQIRCMPLGEEK